MIWPIDTNPMTLAPMISWRSANDRLPVRTLPADTAWVKISRTCTTVNTPTLHHQGMDAVALPRRYRTILAASSALQLLTGPGEADSALARLVDHLEPGGAVVGSFDFGWEEGEPLDSGWVRLFEREGDDGARIRSWTRERHHPDAQVWDAEQRFEVILDGDSVATEHHHKTPEGRWYTQAQAVDLYRSAGLVDIEVTSEFSADPATPDDRLFCVLGVRPRSD